MVRRNKTIGDIVDVLINKAYQVLEWKFIWVMNPQLNTVEEMTKLGLPENYNILDQKKLDEIIRMVQPMMAATQQTRKITAETLKDITKMLKTGKISISEANILLSFTKEKIEIEQKERTSNIQKQMLEMLVNEKD